MLLNIKNIPNLKIFRKMETPTYSVVEFYYNEVPVKRKCGYCKSTNGSQRDGKLISHCEK